MKVRDILDLESKMLQLFESSKLSLNLNDYLAIKKILDEISKVTDAYFDIISRFSQHAQQIKKKGWNPKEELIRKNDKLLDTDVSLSILDNMDKINDYVAIMCNVCHIQKDTIN